MCDEEKRRAEERGNVLMKSEAGRMVRIVFPAIAVVAL
jgi:hypothetical protein